MCTLMLLYASVCIRHASVYTHTPRCASFTLPNANIQHTFPQTVKNKTKHRKKRKIRIASRSVTSLRIRANIPNRVQIGQTKNRNTSFYRKCLSDVLSLLNFAVRTQLRSAPGGQRSAHIHAVPYVLSTHYRMYAP